MKLEVGQKVWVKLIGNEARHLKFKKDATIEDYLSEAEVLTVARKFFTLKGTTRYLEGSKFLIDGMVDDRKGYISGYQVYLSKQEVYDEEEASRLYWEIRRGYFDMGGTGLNLEQLRAIKAIAEGKS